MECTDRIFGGAQWWNLGGCLDAARRGRPYARHRESFGLEERPGVGQCLCPLHLGVGRPDQTTPKALHRGTYRLEQRTNDVSRIERKETIIPILPIRIALD